MSDRPYVMETGWERGIHGDLDGEALYRWAKRLEARVDKLAVELDHRKENDDAT